ncbi:uncharacterized short-chain type dehydrogenase/reductase y4vI-like [Uloborus diversus]|uniref:uncharacterized short-chain type dehydrogenase/reductase y4vI-like n=1 Tax=Uloborus diversus TaxID=327109 RepID=UPI00240970AC|nr:uncharacterized short-chain type dehydrogenase/reductase y4vI-like [Uloborus diversus]
MERWSGKVALVTGASVGIGAEICKELVKHNITVVGCARNVEKIQKIVEEVKNAPGHLEAVKCDISKESEILEVFRGIRQKYGRLDICINNAGFTSECPLISGKTSEWKDMLDVNVLGLCICTREAISLMREKSIDNGQIIQISSMAAHRVPAHGVSFYAGTKFMVRALAEGLRRELKAINSHIRVACISPGVVETEFFERFRGKETAQTLYNSLTCLQAKDIAEGVLYIIQMPQHVDINDILIRPVEQKMEKWNNRVALVTGASTGIGAAICRELVKYGTRVVGCARNVQQIRDLSQEIDTPGSIHAIKCDLTKEDEILSMFEEIREKFGRLDICINNAGLSFDCPLLTGKTSEWRTMIDVNVLALCICTRESVKFMQENKIDDGQIIHISSMSGHRIPAMDISMYAGTKFMVRALTEGLRKELRNIGSHIRVASISPGLVETEFEYRCYSKNPEIARSIYSSIKCMDAKDIAETVIYVLKSPPHVDVNDVLLRPVEQKD